MMKKICIILLSFLFLIIFYTSALYIRGQLIEEYNTGVYYYEIGDYTRSAQIFNELKGWGGRLVEVSPEEYYDLSLEKLLESDKEIVVCPNCGEVIE